MIAIAIALALGFAPPGRVSATAAPTGLWRLDCGRFEIANLEGRGPVSMPVSCYLIRYGDAYLLFDAGLEASLLGKPQKEPGQTLYLDHSLADQLAALGIRPDRIRTLVVSHYHGDHYSQADLFRTARLVVGKGDAEELRKDKTAVMLAPWLNGSRPSVQISSDLDLFGNGSVVALFTPGHTPGHLSLFVRVGAKSYILTGDVVHSRRQLTARRPSGNHVDKVKGVQSIDRLNRLAATTGATIIVGHDKGDLGLLPAFPKGVTAK